MITIYIPPKKAIGDTSQMLTNEISTAVNIKDRMNRNSVISAMTSA